MSRHRLPAGPFIAWLDEQTREHGSLDRLATAAGKDPSQLRRIRRQETVSLGLVDECFVAADDLGALYRLYPL